MTRRPLAAIAAAALALATFSAVAPAHAADNDAAQAAAAEAAIEDLTPADEPSPIEVAPGTGGITATDNGITAELPIDPADGIALTNTDGTTIIINLPGANKADDARTFDETTTVYTDALPGTSLAAQALEDGGARALIVIENADAPTEYRFPIEATTGSTLELQDDGSVNVIDPDGIPVGNIATPWATDGNGRAIPTSYRLDGMSIIQVVHHVDAAYPVVADPKFTWGWVTGTAYYNRAETRSMKTLSFAAIIAAGLCASFAWATAGASCVIGGAFFAQWQYVASNAYGDGKCIKIKIPTFWASAYSDGYCK